MTEGEMAGWHHLLDGPEFMLHGSQAVDGGILSKEH